MTLLNRFVSLLLLYCFVLTALPQARVKPVGNEDAAGQSSSLRGVAYQFLSSLFSTGNEMEETDQEEEGLRFHLSQGAEQPETRQSNKTVAATILSAAETEAVLKRLPAIKAEATDEADFALRERSLPPPRTGRTIEQPFPAPGEMSKPESVATGLEVLRSSPEGEVPIAPNLSVTFSQPMVALTSQEEAATVVPVRLSPQPPGKWHWIGTKTLLFEPEVRFPMATKYSVTVPDGTKSANGNRLANAKTWNFTTPPPNLMHNLPDGQYTQPRDKLMFIEFDQRIDPARVLKSIRVSSASAVLPIRLATKEELEADAEVREAVKKAEKDRWIAFRALDGSGDTKSALPIGSLITVTVSVGMPSAEGPLGTAKAQQFTFRTLAPFRLTEARCGYGLECTPYDQWQFQFSNKIKTEIFDESQLRVEPPLQNFKASVWEDRMMIAGVKKPNTRYRITIDKSIRDQFDQTLGKDETVEFKVGPMRPSIGWTGKNFSVLDPAGPRSLSLYTVNYRSVKVSLYAVQPEDWQPYQIYQQLRYRNDLQARKLSLPGRLVSAKTVNLADNANDILVTAIDLTPALKNGWGQVLVEVEPVDPPPDRYPMPLLSWVQSSRIALDAFVDNDELIGWANSLVDGGPIANAQLQLLPTKLSSTTGADGLAHFALKPANESQKPNESQPSLLVARQGDDVAILPESASSWWASGYWHHRPKNDELRWYVIDDRKLYRPGEEVHLKGWIRRISSGKGGDVGALNGSLESLGYTLQDEEGNDLGKGEVTLNLFGGFDLLLKLPPTMNLGNATVKFAARDGDAKLSGREFEHGFQVQEFRRPEFEVTAKNETEGPLFIGDHADVSVAANYFAGGGLSDAEVKWEVTATSTNFTPPNRQDFIFGRWVPWWRGDYSDRTSKSKQLSGRTDAAGKHRLRLDFDSVKPALPSTVTAQASITDVNRQTWSSSSTILVHPANVYVGIKTERTFVQTGEPLVVQTIVTDLDGKAITAREVKMKAVRLDWRQVKGEWKQLEVEPQNCSVNSGPEAVKCSFISKEGGTYRVTAIVHDDRGRDNQSEMMLWVAGGKQPSSRELKLEKVELIPDRREYKAGETAQILIQAPFNPSEAVMTLRRSGIVRTERFRIDGPTYTLRIPIEEAWAPNVSVHVDLVGNADRETEGVEISRPLSKRPAYASGEINLPIPPVSRKLAVTATPRAKVTEPGAEILIDVEAKDAGGRPSGNTEVAVWVVDESVLALINYQLSDPMKLFYAFRNSDVSDYHSREHVLLASAADLTNPAANNMVLDGVAETVSVNAGRRIEGLRTTGPQYQNFSLLKPGLAAPTSPAPGPKEPDISLRENFNALAVFAPAVHTDANGHAQVEVKLPDNLTRYRVMAVAVAGGKQFGSGESAITARLPLMARPSAPRFLNFGDRFDLPIVLQNQTEQAMSVDVAVRATNAAFMDGSVRADALNAGEASAFAVAGRRVNVPANDRVEVRIPAAALKAGTARFQIGAVSGRWSDGAEIELPVWTPATTEAFATYGEIDQGAITQPVNAPANVFPQFGGLELETSSTQLQELTDAVIYLTSYPYECSEQLASRVISIAALRDVLTAFKARDLPSPAEMEAAVTRDLKRLQGLQNSDGGFGFWRRGDESWPYLSLHVAHAMARARQKKFDVPREMWEKSQKYLREIETHIPSRYSIEARRAIIAYALYVRVQMGDRDAARARRLIAEAGLDKLSLESVGWLLAVLSGDQSSVNEVAAIRRLLNNRVTETSGMAHFVCSYNDSDYLILNSDRRADGVILEALIGDQPTSDLIPKIVRGLLAHRTRGRWANTQENVFILLALDRYFNTFERVTPNFVARAWLGDHFAGEQEFKGRSTDRQQVRVPMRYLFDHPGSQNLILNKDGNGRLYYRIGMNYAPSDLNLKPVDYGFTVVRSYEGLDDPKDVSIDSDGVWHIKAGARVRVRLTMVATSRRYHVALVDPLPAGFESLNPSLATTGSIPQDKDQTGVIAYGSRSYGFGWWWWRPEWFEHQNLRDERTEAFTSLLWEGVYKYSYIARATTPGTFVVPPTKAEEMYNPETFGRGKTDRVKVE
jgi:alpha-2-macroglobulin